MPKIKTRRATPAGRLLQVLSVVCVVAALLFLDGAAAKIVVVVGALGLFAWIFLTDWRETHGRREAP